MIPAEVMVGPRLIVFSSLFPSAAQPQAGLFIRERMFRVGRHLPLVVVSPRAWFPGQGLIRRWRPDYRPQPAHLETQNGIEIRFPRFFALPGLLRRLDGYMMALACLPLLWRLKRQGCNLIDAHFAYPDGYAATLLGRWLGLPVSITLRGTEVPHSRNPLLRPLVIQALARADRVFAVSDSLRQLAISLGLPAEKGRVIGNGIDLERFQAVAREAARRRFGLPDKEKKEFEKAFKSAGESTLIDLTIDSAKPVKVLIQDYQLENLKNRINHIDFYQVRMDEKLHAEACCPHRDFPGQSRAFYWAGRSNRPVP